MVTIIEVWDAQGQLPELIDRACAGENIVLSEDGQLKVRVVAIEVDPSPVTDALTEEL